MSDKLKKDNPIFISDQVFEKREDIYAYTEFGKIVNRYFISDQIVSDVFWNFLKDKFSIKKENTTIFCDIHSDVKNRLEKFYKYIVVINDSSHKLMLQFYDEEKVIDPKIYKTEDEQKNKISDLLIYFEPKSLEYVEKLVNEIRNIVHLPTISKTFFVITSNSMGYDLLPANIKDVDVDISLNYGETFVDKYQDILDKLKNNKHGLFLFHGEPGCGKTYLLRKLVSDISEEKTIIYVPSYFMFDIANPELISFISKFKNSVLLLEDAESILTSTDEERNQAVSNILNISDGLLNDHMDMQIIATFNTSKKVLDAALLRKGRLMVDYKFKKLTAKQATKLSEYIGLNKVYTDSKTLAEIYEEKGSKQLIDIDVENNKIGFKINNNE